MEFKETVEIMLGPCNNSVESVINLVEAEAEYHKDCRIDFYM
jgi:hypothetical protein